MKFNLKQSIDILNRTPKVFRTLLEDLPKEWIRNNEGDHTWSPFDVLGHLIQGEKTDWIPRTKIILQRLDKPFQPFDRFAQFEKSKGKNLDQLLEEFENLRIENIKTLVNFKITEEDLRLTGTHPAFGTITLENLIATWTVHDLNHISQITRVMAKQYKDEVGPWKQYLKILQ
ncbi:MAG: DinB family protein [Bacteroidota bacterium]